MQKKNIVLLILDSNLVGFFKLFYQFLCFV